MKRQNDTEHKPDKVHPVPARPTPAIVCSLMLLMVGMMPIICVILPVGQWQIFDLYGSTLFMFFAIVAAVSVNLGRTSKHPRFWIAFVILATMGLLGDLQLFGISRLWAPKINPDDRSAYVGQLQWTQAWGTDASIEQHHIRNIWSTETGELMVRDCRDKLTRLSADGHTLNEYSLPRYFNPLVWNDLGKEDAVAAAYNSKLQKLFGLDSVGRQLWFFNIDSVKDACWIDLTGDGQEELVFTSYDDRCEIGAVDQKGHVLWKHPDGFGNVRMNWTLAGISKTAPSDALLVTADSDIQLFNGSGKPLYRIGAMGVDCSAANIGDLTGRGNLQLIAAGRLLMGHDAKSESDTSDYVAVGLDKLGTVAWSCPVQWTAEIWRQRQLVPADVDGDGSQEWVLFLKPGLIGVVSGTGKLVARISVPEESNQFAVVKKEQAPTALYVSGPSHLSRYHLAAAK